MLRIVSMFASAWLAAWITASALPAQSPAIPPDAPQPAAPGPAPAALKIYLLLKPALAEAGEARDAFTTRMAALNVSNLQFLAGTNAAKCEAPVSSLAAIAQDAGVAGVLPIEPGKDADAAPPSPNPPQPMQTGAAGPPPSIIPPVTPPFAGMQTSMPIGMGMGGAIPLGGGMSMGLAVLTDFASGVVVKMLNPGPSCKIRLPKAITVVGPSRRTACSKSTHPAIAPGRPYRPPIGSRSRPTYTRTAVPRSPSRRIRILPAIARARF